MHNCTTEDLLLYLDDDLPAVERSNIAAMLQDNWALREKLQVLKEAKEQLNSAPLQAPKHKSLQNVLNHLYKTQKREKLAYATLYPKPAADIR